ncbi:MAG TPA: glycosyltransferase family 39 protein [Micropepsaceae bacterium]|nr:glycosyltransferase family 39 protein [Micropepsaceae bacterium]
MRAPRLISEAIILAVLSVPLLIALTALAYRSTLLVPINYNEGWNAYHAGAAAMGGRLYYPADALVTNNYPPLSFLIVGAVTNIIGDAVFAGRLVVWIGFLGTAWLINAILRRLGNDAIASAFGALLFTAYSVVHFTVYVGVYDPQWLAHAVMLFGLWLYVRKPDALGSSVAAGVVMGLALFIKHNIVALPMAFVLWLFIYDRRASFRFAAAGLLTGALGLAACFAVFGSDFFTGLLAPRSYSVVDGYRYGLSYLEPMEVPLLVFALGAIILRDRYMTFFLLLVCVALPLGLIQRTGEGVAINAMFELLIALSLGAGHDSRKAWST